MLHPWANMTEQEYVRRKGVMHIVMLGGGVALVILFAVQIRSSLSRGVVQTGEDPFAGSAEFFRSVVSESKKPVDDINKMTSAVANMVDLQIKQAAAEDAVITQLKANLNADTQEDGSSTDDTETETVPVPDENASGASGATGAAGALETQ